MEGTKELEEPLAGTNIVEAAWASPRVPRSSPGCRTLDVLGLHSLWANNSQRGQDPPQSAGGCARSYFYPLPRSLGPHRCQPRTGTPGQLAGPVREPGTKKGQTGGRIRADTARGCLELAVTAAYDPGTCSSRLERPSRAPGKWRVAETGNYISQKAGRSRGHRESAPAGGASPAQWGRFWG